MNTDTRDMLRNAALISVVLGGALFVTGCVVRPDERGIVDLWARSAELGNRIRHMGPGGGLDEGECQPKDITGCGSKLVGTHGYYVDALANGKLGFTNRKTGEFTMADPEAKGTRLRRASEIGATVSFKD